MTKILITGGAGFIGSHIAEELMRRNLGDVTIFDDLSSGFERNIAHIRRKVKFIRGDTRNMADIEGAMVGIEYVFHNAALVSAFDSYNKPELTREVNIVGTQNVLAAALNAGVKRVVLASSAAIYGPNAGLPNSEEMKPDPASPYAEAKLQNEIDAKEYAKRGLGTVSLRYFNVFGPRQDPSSEYSGVISRFKEINKAGKTPVIYGDGSQTRDFIYVKDVAGANILAGLNKNCGNGEVFNIGTGRETSLLQLIDAFGKAMRRKIDPEFRPRRVGDIKRSVADVSLAKKVLGFEAETDFNSGIKLLVAGC